MKVRLTRSLVAQSYLLALGCVLLMFVAQGVLFQFLRPDGRVGPPPDESHGLLSALGAIDDELVAVRVVAAVAREEHGDLTVLDRRGEIIAEHGRPAPELDPRARDELARTGAYQGPGYSAAVVRGGALDGAILVRRSMPPHGPPRPDFPLVPVAITLGATLLIALAMSWWFARRLAAPLLVLRDAADRFGAGDLSARAVLQRQDELGVVGTSFDEMATRINTLLAANRALLANVSHELRTPMARIRVALDLADENPAKAHARLAGVSRDLAELEALVGDTLTMLRLDSGNTAPPLRLAPVAPADLAGQAASRWREVHGARALHVDVAPELPTVACDPVLMRRVIDNLLDNAAKYSRGEPVALAVRAHAGRVVFVISDRGAGMSPEELSHAFTPFWRSDKSRNRGTGGVGLGLALARQISRAHGGDVVLESTPGQGSVATVSLPAIADGDDSDHDRDGAAWSRA